MTGEFNQLPARVTAWQSKDGQIDPVWYRFLSHMWRKTGAGASSVTLTGLDGTKVAKAGDTMTGPLILSGAPTVPLQAATKAYADAGGAAPSPTLPFPVSIAAVGAEARYSHGDHVHGTSGQTGYIARIWEAGAIAADGTYSGGPAALRAFQINSLTAVAVTGTFTVAVKINGVSVTGLGAVAVTAASTTTIATGLNAAPLGALVTFVITSSASSPADVTLTVNTQRTT